jgi:glycosyltransferase involved in cell wall biosynthesis
MRKYLFLSTNENWGGSELLWTSAAKKLFGRGNEVRVSVPESNRVVPQVEHLRLAGCLMFYRRGFPSFLYRWGRRFLPLSEYNDAQIRKAAEGVDLVVISQGANFEALPWMENARAAGDKYVVIAQSAVPYWWPNDDVAEKLALNYENASAAYFVSQATLDLSRRQFGSPLRNGKVVRNPFNVLYDVQLAWPSNPSEELDLACVARLDVISKAQDVLLQVLALPHWRQRKIRLSLVGNGPNERGLHRIVDQLSLSNVQFAGHQNNIEEVWRKHHMLVLPSRFEGMPLTVVEAMLCGRPCVATDVGGNRELIRDGINGFLAKAATVELLDEAMNRAWESRDGLREMGCRAANDVRQFVPRDPGEDFARELAAVAGDSREMV